MAAVAAPNQVLGRTLAIGCTAVEITQRCNLDCSLCYLSEHSEHVVDIPIEEIFRRLDTIRQTYGPSANVQITGGDPTLRKDSELLEIVAYARRLELFPALFTNGIAASRTLLAALADAGLTDVAFHVDTTQKRAGFDSERALHVIRREYLERARGLGLMVIFNTTLHDGNFHELPDLVQFFTDHADVVGFASFQLQAETGRGEWGPRGPAVSLAAARSAIDRHTGRVLPWEAIRIGHPQCHSYLPTFVIGGEIVPIVEDQDLVGDFLADFAGAHKDRRAGCGHVARHYLVEMLRRPRWLWRAARFTVRHLWRSRTALIRARARVHKLSFFVQNFMDARALDEERIATCSFMVMTADGPVSVCEHNAHRDEYILKSIHFRRADGSLGHYEPLAGRRRRSDHRPKQVIAS
jgi:pyruvate-formate lyase-activating enzyme